MNTVIAGGQALLVGLGAVALAVTGPVTGPVGAGAATKAKVSVTISQVNTEMSGKVTSSKPAKCAKNRTVWVWEQIGARGGGDDVKRFKDTTSKQGNAYVWNTGNTGVEGYFYAKVPAKPGCRAAVSKTIKSVRNT
ncbi:hypothetical protein [Nocardioides sp.]|uniref:hypothetical protein n=1 Tax=Nocardioides sp. TaxID=35761 RepID=UPI00356A0925